MPGEGRRRRRSRRGVVSRDSTLRLHGCSRGRVHDRFASRGDRGGHHLPAQGDRRQCEYPRDEHRVGAAVVPRLPERSAPRLLRRPRRHAGGAALRPADTREDHVRALVSRVLPVLRRETVFAFLSRRSAGRGRGGEAKTRGAEPRPDHRGHARRVFQQGNRERAEPRGDRADQQGGARRVADFVRDAAPGALAAGELGRGACPRRADRRSVPGLHGGARAAAPRVDGRPRAGMVRPDASRDGSGRDTWWAIRSSTDACSGGGSREGAGFRETGKRSEPACRQAGTASTQ